MPSNHHQSHYPWVDWIRFLAALMVLLVHARGGVFVEYGALPSDQKTEIIAIAYALTRLGNEAVIVFFVMSGYFVAGRGIERMLQGRMLVLEYAIDRLTRIYVPLLPALALSWLCVSAGGSNAKTSDLFVNLFSLQGLLGPVFAGNAPLWSLAYEFWFYVLIGAVGAFADRRRTLRFLSIMVIVLVAVVFTILSPIYLMCWLMGGLLYFYRPASARFWPVVASIGLCCFGAAGTQLGVRSQSFSTTISEWLPSLQASQVLLSAGIALFLSQIVCLRPKNRALIRLEGFGSHLAAFSYSLYLTHYPILGFLQNLLVVQRDNPSVGSVGIYFVEIAFCVLFAVVFYWLFERHTSLLRNLIRNTMVPRAA